MAQFAPDRTFDHAVVKSMKRLSAMLQSTKYARDASLANFAKTNPLSPLAPHPYPVHLRHQAAHRQVTRQMSSLSMGRTPSTAELPTAGGGLYASQSSASFRLSGGPISPNHPTPAAAATGQRRFFGSAGVPSVPETGEWADQGGTLLTQSSKRRFLPAHRALLGGRSFSQQRLAYQSLQGSVLDSPAEPQPTPAAVRGRPFSSRRHPHQASGDLLAHPAEYLTDDVPMSARRADYPYGSATSLGSMGGYPSARSGLSQTSVPGSRMSARVAGRVQRLSFN